MFQVVSYQEVSAGFGGSGENVGVIRIRNVRLVLSF